MGEVREVGNLAFLTKKGLFGGKMALQREHKTSQKAQRLRLSLNHCACRREVANLPMPTVEQSAWQARWAGTVTGRSRCFCSRRPRVFFAVKKGSWRNP